MCGNVQLCAILAPASNRIGIVDRMGDLDGGNSAGLRAGVLPRDVESRTRPRRAFACSAGPRIIATDHLSRVYEPRAPRRPAPERREEGFPNLNWRQFTVHTAELEILPSALAPPLHASAVRSAAYPAPRHGLLSAAEVGFSLDQQIDRAVGIPDTQLLFSGSQESDRMCNLRPDTLRQVRSGHHHDFLRMAV